MIKSDLHSHTRISHGTAGIGEMCGAARKAGLENFGFSEHSPLPDGFSCQLYTGDLAGDFPGYVEEVLNLKAVSAKPRILLGLELDWLPGKKNWLCDLTQNYPFDYVYGSLHYLDGLSVGRPDSWENTRSERFERFGAYFGEMAGMAASGITQIASHPDFIKIRVWDDFKLWLQTPAARDSIVYALESLAKHNMAMEINSAGLRMPFREPYPGPEIMALAKDIGVNICFGSDAHSPGDVASDFDFLADYARSFGFSRSLIFVDREPLPLPF